MATPVKQPTYSQSVFDAFLHKLAGADNKMTGLQKQELTRCLIMNAVAFISILFGIITAYYVTSKPNSQQTKYTTYLLFIILPVLLGIGLSTQIFETHNKPTTTVFILVSLIGMVAISMYFLIYNSTNVFVNKMFNYLGILFLVVSLAVGYRLFVKYLKNMPGWFGFIIKLLFYIPCLVLDLFEAVRTQMVLTSATKYGFVFIAGLVLAVCLLLAYYIYKGVRKLTVRNLVSQEIASLHSTSWFSLHPPTGISLHPATWFSSIQRPPDLFQPMSLSKQHTIATNEMMMVSDGTSMRDIINPVEDVGSLYHHNYSIECWVNITTVMPNERILSYGQDHDVVRAGKPSIITVDGEKPFALYFTDNYTNSDDAVFYFNMPLQKWNYLVITYDNHTVTLYINSELVFSREVTKGTAKLPSYTRSDTIVVGTNKGKMHGFIRDINYHIEPMSLRNITTTYKVGG